MDDATPRAAEHADGVEAKTYGWEPTHPSLLADLEAGEYPAS